MKLILEKILYEVMEVDPNDLLVTYLNQQGLRSLPDIFVLSKHDINTALVRSDSGEMHHYRLLPRQNFASSMHGMLI